MNRLPRMVLVGFILVLSNMNEVYSMMMYEVKLLLFIYPFFLGHWSLVTLRRTK